MTPDELQAAAQAILGTIEREHSADDARGIVIALLAEIMAMGLHGPHDEVATGAFVLAVNTRLAAIAGHAGSARAWKLVAVDGDA